MNRSGDDSRIRREYFDWYVISKKTLYMIGAGLILILIIIGIALYRYFNPPGPVDPDVVINEEIRLVQTSGNVTIYRANNGNVELAVPGMSLYEGDRIQTGSGSTASLQFIDGSTLRIKENSTVVVKQNSREVKTEKTQVESNVAFGTVNMSNPASAPASGSVNNVTAPGVSVSFQSGTQGTINYDGQTTKVVSEKGNLNVVTDAGTAQVISENRGSEFKDGAKVNDIAYLPSPKLRSPENSELRSFNRGTSPEILFTWSPVPGAVSYNFQIATSNSFVKSTIIAERNQRGTSTSNVFRPYDGNYYWRVQGVEGNGKEGIWSNEQRLQIVIRASGGKDTPIYLPRPTYREIGRGIYEVTGETEPGVQLRINGKNVPVGPDGKYMANVDLNGNQSVMFVAQDSQGRTRTENYPPR
ncbi:MAG: FecR domain-containing protein [Acidobacteria bacterium]|nr:FecR domain-containing protein [Acidobacteriota bacterium]